MCVCALTLFVSFIIFFEIYFRCKIPESDFATDKECTGNVDAQPYEIDCGQYIVKKPGEWKNHCIAGFCNETNDIFCQQVRIMQQMII